MSQPLRTGWTQASVSVIAVCVILALGIAGTGHPDDPPPHVVFVTSVNGTGDLGSWPEAQIGTSGVDAGDSICQNQATIAGLANPLDFVAWLSDSDDDAYCRVHGVTGKVSNNCDGATLVAAGPWVRTDGHPFAPTIDRLLSPTNEVYTPLKYDENGQAVSAVLFTGTSGTGGAGSELCTDGGTLTDWASSTGAGRVGTTHETGSKWTYAFIGLCSSGSRLICIEKGQGGPLPPFGQVGKLAFVTSVSGTGELSAWPEADAGTSGIAAGDSICRNLATAAGLPVPDSFRAWLSDSTTDAKDRFVLPGPWVRVDGVVVFPSPADLATFNLFTALNLTETGAYLANGRAWTGTGHSGTAASERCSEWLDGTTGSQGLLGYCTSTTSGWTTNVSRSCDQEYRLYCLALDNGIFADGFESGDPTGWSNWVPQ